LSILAGVAALPIIGARASTQVTNWHGIALGAEAQIVLDHPNAEFLIAGAVAEIRRLEGIFSLYLPNSNLSQLNRDGILHAPTFEMVELLSTCANLHQSTGGRFDQTVQALWALYARSFSNGLTPTDEQIIEAQKITGWQYVKFSPDRISFDRAGVMLTLNGIAQGFIADKITSYIRQNGVVNVMVNTGEIAAIGFAPDGDNWQVHFKNNAGAISLNNAAIATSAPLGTAFDTNGTIGHILDPRTGRPGGVWSEVSVIAKSASEADGLSTAFSMMSELDINMAKGSVEVILRA
jgi:thiamine biosynthesis lipoprotein